MKILDLRMKQYGDKSKEQHVINQRIENMQTWQLPDPKRCLEVNLQFLDSPATPATSRGRIFIKMPCMAAAFNSLRCVASHATTCCDHGVVLVIIFLLAHFRPWIAPQDPAHRSAHGLMGPSAALVRHR